MRSANVLNCKHYAAAEDTQEEAGVYKKVMAALLQAMMMMAMDRMTTKTGSCCYPKGIFKFFFNVPLSVYTLDAHLMTDNFKEL